MNPHEPREPSRASAGCGGPGSASEPAEALAGLLAPEGFREEARGRIRSRLKLLETRLHRDLYCDSIELVRIMARAAPEHTRALIQFLPDLFGILPEDAGRLGIEQAGRIARFSGFAAYGFLSHLVQIHRALGIDGTGPWVDRGIRLLERNLRAGEAFFALKSTSGRRALEQGAHTVTLGEVRDSLRLYTQGLTGSPLALHSTADGLPLDAGLYSRIYPCSDGLAIYLPPQVDVYPTCEENALYYKILCSHQAGYFESGTFGFSLFSFLGRLARHPALRKWKPSVATEALSGDFFSHLQIFYTLFPDPLLAQALFTLVEDGRVDAHLRHRYPGLRKDLAFFVGDALALRLPLEGMPVRDAFLELVLRLSLDPEKPLSEEAPHLSLVADHVRRLLKGCFHAAARVEDAALISTELYGLLSALVASGVHQPLEALPCFIPPGGHDGSKEPGSLQIPFHDDRAGHADGASPEQLSLEDLRLRVELRGDTDLGLAQRGLQIRQDLEKVSSEESRGPWQTIPLEEMKRLLEQGIEPALSLAPEDGPEGGLLFFFEGPQGPHSLLPLRKRLETGEGARYRKIWALRREHRRCFREPDENVFYYEEWDFHIQDYRRDWCRLTEREGKSSRRDFVGEVRTACRPLISSLRRQFEMLRPEQYRMEKALLDGEDIDLDRTVESIVDRRCGIRGSDRLYRERRRIERDVSTLFLLDMSASTDERVRISTDNQSAPAPIPEAGRLADDSLTQLSRILSGIRSGSLGRQEGSEARRLREKRIIDIEKEALVLLAEALEPLGDRYGVFGFSGSGRLQVEFHTIKEFSERYGSRVRDRISGIEPRGSTRMGTALRHCRAKLRKEDARRKNLFLVSDGFPQDQEYGESRTGYEYAVQDTARALAELEREGTYTYCITVDRHGEDYLGRMCPESQYMVIEDIWSLPERLLKIYRKVTDQAIARRP